MEILTINRVARYTFLFLKQFTVLLLLYIFGLMTPAQAELVAIDDEVIVAVPQNFPPYYLQDDNGQPQGFAIDVFNAIAARAGIRFQYRVYANWRQTMDAIQSGQADVIPLFGMTPERVATFDFTSSIMTFPIQYFVRTSFTEANSPQDLKNHRVAAVRSNAAFKHLMKRKDITVEEYSSLDAAFHALISGQVDAFAYPTPVAVHMVKEYDLEDKIRALEPPVMELKHAMALGNNNSTLKDKLQLAQAAFISSEDYNKIYRRWLVYPEKQFWNVQRVFWFMAGLILILILGFLIFRHREILSVNESLQQQIDEATQQLSQSNAYLKDLTVTDTLTGINNRRAFENSLHEFMHQAQRYEYNFSMLIFDIDDFKRLNDEYGHSMGDRVLKDLVERVEEVVRDVDMLCRWGGEEFTILMPQTNKSGALKMAERCRSMVADELFDEVGLVTISVGGTCFVKGDSERKFFKRADDALYQAKAEGKNKVVWKEGDC